MKLKNKITVSPPNYSDKNGKLITPEPIILDTLNVMYIDNPHSQNYYVQISRFPSPLTLYSSEDYNKSSPINKIDGEKKLQEILGDNPEKILRGLFPKTIEEHPYGPGAILSQMIKSVGIVMTEGCSCKRHAILMNEKGNDWCEQNIDTIVGWLREESKKRKLPFIDTIGKLIVNRAIKKSRLLSSNQKPPENDEDLDKINE
jgi:hypothetical protein